MDITRTIQATEKKSWVDQLFDGSLQEAWFPLPGRPRKAGVGDWLYVIYQKRSSGAVRSPRFPRIRSQIPSEAKGIRSMLDAEYMFRFRVS